MNASSMGYPGQRGLYSPAFEHDACGIGAVVLELGVIEAQRPFLLREIFHRLSHPFFDFPENILAMLRHIPQSPS